ncbi:MAG: hypothetical protein ACK4SY_06025 [Pyrobaculum sp.]
MTGYIQVEALKKGDLDAIVVGEVVGRVISSRHPELRAAFTVVPRYSAIAMPLCAYNLKLAVDRVLYDMLQLGELERIIMRNGFLHSRRATTSSHIRWVYPRHL